MDDLLLIFKYMIYTVLFCAGVGFIVIDLVAITALFETGHTAYGIAGSVFTLLLIAASIIKFDRSI